MSKMDEHRKRALVASYTWLTFDPPLINLGTMLSRRGHDVEAVGIGRKEDPASETLEPGFRIKRAPYRQTGSSLLKLRLSLSYLVLLLRSARLFKPTCYIAANWNSFLACLIARRFIKAPILYYQLEYHGRTRDALASASLPARLALELEKRLVKHAHTLFSAEPNRSRLMQRDYGLPYTPTAIFNAPLSKEQSPTVRRKNSSATPRIVYAGSIHEKTCMVPLLETLATGKIDASFDFYGAISTGFEKRFNELLDETRKRGNSIAYKGCVSYASVHDVLADYDIGIAFYRSNTLNQYFCSPCKLFEYMAAGLALLTSDFPGLRSIVHPPAMGLCVDAEDPSAIRDALKNLTKAPPSSIRAMGERAQQAFLEKFTFDRQAEPLIRAIEHV